MIERKTQALLQGRLRSPEGPNSFQPNDSSGRDKDRFWAQKETTGGKERANKVSQKSEVIGIRMSKQKIVVENPKARDKGVKRGQEVLDATLRYNGREGPPKWE